MKAKEVMKILRRTYSTVRDLRMRGRIDATKTATGRYNYDPESIFQWLNKVPRYVAVLDDPDLPALLAWCRQNNYDPTTVTLDDPLYTDLMQYRIAAIVINHPPVPPFLAKLAALAYTRIIIVNPGM